MSTRCKLSVAAILAMVGLVLPVRLLLAVDPPAPPPVSQFAPAADLSAQLRLHLADFETALADEAAYADKKDKVRKDAHTLAAVALALGLHDTANDYQAAAPALVKGAQDLAAAEDFPAAQAAFEAIRQTVAGVVAEGPKLDWNRQVAPLEPLMKQVTFINNRLRRGVQRLAEDKKDENARYAALLAVIAQAVTVDTHVVKNPDDIARWQELCGDMRDAAGEANAAIHAGDRAGVDAAMMKLDQSCVGCHKEFRE